MKKQTNNVKEVPFNRRDDLNKKLLIISERFDIITTKPSNDFIRDYIIISYVLYGDIKDFKGNLWKTIMKKYELPDVSIYFENSFETLKIVFEKCIHPYYLRLDILPDFNHKYKTLSTTFEREWNINRFWINNRITIIATILMCIFLVIALSFISTNRILYDIFLSLSSGFMISILISMMNFYHKRQLRLKKAEFNEILYGFRSITSAYNIIKEALSTDIQSTHDFVMQFATFNNRLDRYLKDTDEIKSLTTSSNYLWFKDFNDEIFEFMSTIVNAEFKYLYGDLITEDQINRLKMYVLEFGYYLSYFEKDILSLEHHYGQDIGRMEDKSI